MLPLDPPRQARSFELKDWLKSRGKTPRESSSWHRPSTSVLGPIPHTRPLYSKGLPCIMGFLTRDNRDWTYRFSLDTPSLTDAPD
ncbi:hypothetical protein AAMO2058_001226400 [Amorphochlora amoebiformis]